MKHFLALTFLLSVVPLSQPQAAGGWDRNGVRLNGVRLNGVRLNGVRLNGVRLNGVGLNGVRLNGPEIGNGSPLAEVANATGAVTLSDAHTVGGKLTR